MEIAKRFDLLTEAMAYLGRKAAGKDWHDMAGRIRMQKKLPDGALPDTLAVLEQLTDILDRSVPMSESSLQSVFGNLEGFPYNTVGSGSRAFLLFYPFLEAYRGDMTEFARYVASLDSERIYWGIASIFEDDLPESGRLSSGDFVNLVLGLSAPDSTKLELLKLSRDYGSFAPAAAELLLPVVKQLEKNLPLLEKAARPFLEGCAAMDCSEFFSSLSNIRPDPGIQYEIRPFVFGADTILSFDPGDGRTGFYCGVLRRELTELVSGRSSSQDQVCDIYRLLGDPTRFDILCYLRGRNAYVQELSNRFGLSRNTIHHHMNKLIDCGLVRCDVKGNRMYYSLNQEAIRIFLDRQSSLFT